MLPGIGFQLHSYTKTAKGRNTRKPSESTFQHEPELTKGGKVIKRRCPQWSVSLCNAVAGLAGIGQEVRHVG